MKFALILTWAVLACSMLVAPPAHADTEGDLVIKHDHDAWPLTELQNGAKVYLAKYRRGESGGVYAASAWQDPEPAPPGTPCTGYIPDTPQHLIELQDPNTLYMLEVVSDRPVELVVREPSGRIRCQPSSYVSKALENYNAPPGYSRRQDLHSETGIYEIYVGSRQAGLGHPYVLAVRKTANPSRHYQERQNHPTLPGKDAFRGANEIVNDSWVCARRYLNREGCPESRFPDKAKVIVRDQSSRRRALESRWNTSVLQSGAVLSLDVSDEDHQNHVNHLTGPTRFSGRVRGLIAAPSASDSHACLGYISETPQHRVVTRVPSSRPHAGQLGKPAALRFIVFTRAEKNEPLTLVIYDRVSKQLACNTSMNRRIDPGQIGDTMHGVYLDVLPSAKVDGALHADLEIYVATPERGQERDYVLSLDWCDNGSEPRLDDLFCPQSWKDKNQQYKMIGGIPAIKWPAEIGLAAPAASQSARVRHLSAVRRLRAAGGHLCTGTVVDWNGATLFLTAAHCLYRVSAQGRIGSLRSSIMIEGIGELSMERARVARSFRRCAARGMSYSACVTEGGTDIALVPLPYVPDTIAPWPVCRAMDARDLTIFGYGRTERGVPGELMSGRFAVMQAPGSGVWHALGRDHTRVAGGDSGGPVVSSQDDRALHFYKPHVCFITVGFRQDRDAQRVAALVQPLWNLAAELDE